MENLDRVQHWERIYQTKTLAEVSWFEPVPETSLAFFKQFNVPTTAKIIDVGGGDSLLVDALLALGYENISVLDISATAIARAKHRLGSQANRVNWIVADAATFKPTQTYDFWHDRAAFHFLTEDNEIATYLKTAHQSITAGGVMVLGTFSEQGPTKCSGIEIKQYSEAAMTQKLRSYFDKVKCITVNHTTPFNTVQNFVFCSFRKSVTT